MIQSYTHVRLHAMTDQSDTTTQATQGFEQVKQKRKRKRNAVDMEEEVEPKEPEEDIEIKRPNFPPVDASVSLVGFSSGLSHIILYPLIFSRVDGLSFEVSRFHHTGLLRSKRTG